MAEIKEIRRIDATDLQNLCIKHNWYTAGNSKEYSNLLFNLAESKENLTTNDIITIANDIIEHSSNMENELLTSVCFEITRICYTFFEVKED